MPDKMIDFSLFALVLISMIAGGMGGAAVAGHHVLRGRALSFAYVLAYLVVGAVIGLIAALVGIVYAGMGQGEHVLMISLIAGAAGSMLLAAGNLSLRFILHRLGVEVVVNVRDNRKDGCNG